MLKVSRRDVTSQAEFLAYAVVFIVAFVTKIFHARHYQFQSPFICPNWTRCMD